MGYYVSNMIGIRIGGIFSDKIDLDDFKSRIAKVIAEMRDTNFDPDISDDPSSCMSGQLEAHKGSYIVIAGIFNYWTFNISSEFSKRLSIEFGTEVMHICWNEQKDEIQCQIFLDGHSLFEVAENPIGRILRRVTGH